MDIGERLARLEAGQDWIKVILTLIGAVMIGGFAFLGVQINRIDTKVDALVGSLDAKISGEASRLDRKIDALGAHIEAQGAQTRQELVGIATAIANSITATRQVQPQVIVVPTPTPGAPAPSPNQPPKQ